MYFANQRKEGVTKEKVWDEIEKDLELSGITAPDLQNDLIYPIVIEYYRKEVSKVRKMTNIWVI